MKDENKSSFINVLEKSRNNKTYKISRFHIKYTDPINLSSNKISNITPQIQTAIWHRRKEMQTLKLFNSTRGSKHAKRHALVQL